jgi:pimeloyl-ACP methyl ester carboxylesterase
MHIPRKKEQSMLQHHQISLPHENAGSLSLYQWENEVSERPVLHWAHANGFNGRTYDPLLSPLAAQFDVYAWDARGHGLSTFAAEPKKMTGWDIYGRDLIALVEHLAEKHGRKIWLGGHSMGGFTSVFVAAQRPDLVAGLILADPVIVPRIGPLTYLVAKITGKHGGLALAKMAAKRRVDWPSKEKIKAAYFGRGAFASWQDGFLDAYVEGGVLPHDDGSNKVSLACAPHWEAANFKGPQLNCHAFIRRIKAPFTLLTAEHGSTTRARQSFATLDVDKKISVVAGTSHFLPMEVPDLLRGEIIDRIEA